MPKKVKEKRAKKAYKITSFRLDKKRLLVYNERECNKSSDTGGTTWKKRS